jgi:hypothetical protein
MPSHGIKEFLAIQTAADNELRIKLAEKRRVAKSALEMNASTHHSVVLDWPRVSAIDSAVAAWRSLVANVVRHQPA